MYFSCKRGVVIEILSPVAALYATCQIFWSVRLLAFLHRRFFCRGNLADVGLAFFAGPVFGTVFGEAGADPGRLAARGANQLYVRHRDRHLHRESATLRIPAAAANVFVDDVHAFDFDFFAGFVDGDHPGFLSTARSRENDDLVIFGNSHGSDVLYWSSLRMKNFLVSFNSVIPAKAGIQTTDRVDFLHWI